MGRVLPGILMAASWLLLLFFGPFELFWAVIVLGAAVGLYEYFRMTAGNLSGGCFWPVLLTGLLPVLASSFASSDAVTAGMIAALLGIVLLVLFRYSRLDDVLSFVCRSGFAVLYIGLCSSHLVLLHGLDGGRFWLIILTAITAGSDTGAYYAGRRFGRKKLCPHISPGKTVAGAVGGVLAGVFAAGLLTLILPVTPSLFGVGLAAIFLVMIGIAGDLLESVIKRAVEVKDSGTLLGGHGGLLDRIDSLLLSAPVLYYFVYFGVLS